MHVIRDYSKSEAPAFDAVNDVMDWFGDRYDAVASKMSKITDPDVFEFYCNFAGIEGMPVRAWYDHFHGEGNFEFRRAEKDAMGEIVDVSGML